MQKKTSLAVALITAGLLTACGGGGGGGESRTSATTTTGTFVDAPVQGLTYKTPTQNGTTDADGKFKYITGEKVDFWLGNIFLGSAQGASVISPYNITDNNESAINIALLLQNLDPNRTDDKIDVSSLRDFTFDFNVSDRNALETKLSTLLATPSFQEVRGGTDFSYIDPVTAQTQMNDYLFGESQSGGGDQDPNEPLPEVDNIFTQGWLEGKTLYFVETDTDDKDSDSNTTELLITGMSISGGNISYDYNADGTSELTDAATYSTNAQGELVIESNGTILSTEEFIGLDDTKLTTKIVSGAAIPYVLRFLSKADAQAYVDLQTNGGDCYTNGLPNTIISLVTGREWMACNMGATKICDSKVDQECYGDYYQWGRNDTAFNNVGSSGSFDWFPEDADGSLRAASWDICPAGFSVPNEDEIANESIMGADDGFEKLRLPQAGVRQYETDNITFLNSYGVLWTRDPIPTPVPDSYSDYSYHYAVSYHYFNSRGAVTYDEIRGTGASVRCIKD